MGEGRGEEKGAGGVREKRWRKQESHDDGKICECFAIKMHKEEGIGSKRYWERNVPAPVPVETPRLHEH